LIVDLPLSAASGGQPVFFPFCLPGLSRRAGGVLRTAESTPLATESLRHGCGSCDEGWSELPFSPIVRQKRPDVGGISGWTRMVPDASAPLYNRVGGGRGNVAVAPFCPNPPGIRDGPDTHMIPNCYAVYRFDAVKQLTQRLHIHLRFTPLGLTDLASCSRQTAVSSAP
jgi:hypothetical protein